MADSADSAAKGAEDTDVAAEATSPATVASKEPAAEEPGARAEPAPKVTKKKTSPRRGAAHKARSAAPAAPEPTITELKEKIMANAKTPDFTKPMTDAVSEMQARTKAAYDQGAELASEMTEFSRGNVEAFAESGKVLAGGMQDLGKTYVEEAKSAYETLTADLKDMASVKSPTELLQLQARLARRNFDAMFAQGSRNGEAMMKLASESFAPIAGRLSLAAKKVSRAA